MYYCTECGVIGYKGDDGVVRNDMVKPNAIMPHEDYCTNAMPVLEKVGEYYHSVRTWKALDGTSKKEMWWCCIEKPADVTLRSGDTIHEAICRAAVKYLKAQEVGNG